MLSRTEDFPELYKGNKGNRMRDCKYTLDKTNSYDNNIQVKPKSTLHNTKRLAKLTHGTGSTIKYIYIYIYI